MKSRIISSTSACIIAYKQQENLAVLEKLADKFRIKLVVAEDDDANSPLGYFAGISGYKKSQKSASAEKGCIILSGFSGKQIDPVLAELRKSGASIPLKAVLTPSNQGWSVKELVSELEKERERLGG